MSLPSEACTSRPGARDPRIDFWRGLCLVGMISWHLLSDPSFPRWFSFPIIQGFNFVAEGFVLLAGAAVGISAGRSSRPRAAHYVRRALGLLGLHYVLAAIPWLACRAPGANGSSPPADLAAAIGAILTLEYQPYLGDILSLFVFLFGLTPLLLLAERSAGPEWLLGGSVAVYLGANLLPSPWRNVLELNRHGAFDVGSWQLVFVLGMLLGKQREKLVAKAQALFRPVLWIALAGFALMFIYRLVAEKQGSWSEGLPHFLLFDRHPLTPARLVYILLEMLLIALLTIRFWDGVASWWPVRAIQRFGRNSLAVFACSVLLDYGLKALLAVLGWPFPLNLMIWALDLGALYLVAGVRAQRLVSFEEHTRSDP